MDKIKSEDDTLDTFYLGKISVLQKKKGYRFSLDAPLLADFIQTSPSDEMVELGTGHGIVSLLLSIKDFKFIVAIEIQTSLAQLAYRNIILNHLQERIFIVQQDLLTFFPKKRFDVVFSNPPYIAKNKGQLSKSVEKSIAKHELKCDIFDIMQKTSEILKKSGRAYFIFPEKRKDDFMQAAESQRLRIKVFRSIVSSPAEKPMLFLAECNFTASKIEQKPPLFIYDQKGDYAAETHEIFTGRVHGSSF